MIYSSDTKMEYLPVDSVDRLMMHFSSKQVLYPRDLIEEIQQQKDNVIPELLALVEEFVKHPPRECDSKAWLGGITALFILAKWKEQSAFPLVVNLCLLPHKTLDYLLGDIITESLGALVASTFNGDIETLYLLITNQHLHEFVRRALLNALVTLYKHDVLSRNQLIAIFSRLFDDIVSDFSSVPSALVRLCNKINAIELWDQIKYFHSQGVLDKREVDFKEIQNSFTRSRELVLSSLSCDKEHRFVNDLKSEIGWLFDDKNDDSHYDSNDDVFLKLERLLEEEVVVPKIGRNELCFCASGKKYKKCCLQSSSSLL
ncbi:DUF1186 domain-containing protein [Candidatus Dependentiae bacterium]|nr:DUF1186 domain-containing protein [Candidatus Dependentiae bacterium]